MLNEITRSRRGDIARTDWVEFLQPLRAGAEKKWAQRECCARVNGCSVALTWQSIAQETRRLKQLAGAPAPTARGISDEA